MKPPLHASLRSHRAFQMCAHASAALIPPLLPLLLLLAFPLLLELEVPPELVVSVVLLPHATPRTAIKAPVTHELVRIFVVLQDPAAVNRRFPRASRGPARSRPIRPQSREPGSASAARRNGARPP